MDIEIMCKVVEDYIYERKGVRITINRHQFNGGFIEFTLLNQAYQIAVEFNKQKGGTNA